MQQLAFRRHHRVGQGRSSTTQQQKHRIRNSIEPKEHNNSQKRLSQRQLWNYSHTLLEFNHFLTLNVRSLAMKLSASTAVEALREVPFAMAAVSLQERMVYFCPAPWNVMKSFVLGTIIFSLRILRPIQG